MAAKVVNNLGASSLVPASVARRDWGSALAVGGLAAAGVAFVSGVLLWRNLPMLPAPSASFKDVVSAIAASGVHRIVPFLFSDTAAGFHRYIQEIGQEGKAHLLYTRLWAAGGLGAVAGFFACKSAATPYDGIMHSRGRQLIEGGRAVQMAQSTLAAQVKAVGADLKIHPEIIFTREQWSKHLLIFGAIGGGKTTIILPVLKQLFARNDKALIFDVKGDFTAKFPTAALVAPWHKGGMPWAIGRDIATLQDAILFAEQVIAESKDPMWAAAARQVFVGLVVDLQRRKPKRWGWQDLYDQLSISDEAELELLMERCNPMGLRSVSGQNTTTSGILINMVAGLQWIASLAQAWGNPKEGEGISFVEWLFDENAAQRQIILQGNGRFEQMMQGYASTIITMLASRINSPEFSESRTRKIWFVLDEFPQLGKVKYQPLIEVGRSKGVRVVIGLQDINQVIKVYSEQDANSLLSMVGTKIVAQIAPGETAKKVSELIGEREVERTNISVSGSGSGSSSTTMTNRESLKVMYDSQLSYELGNRPEMGGIVALMINNDSPYVSMLTWPHDSTPDVRASYDEAEWVNGGARDDYDQLSPDIQDGGPEDELLAGRGRKAPSTSEEMSEQEFRQLQAMGRDVLQTQMRERSAKALASLFPGSPKAAAAPRSAQKGGMVDGTLSRDGAEARGAANALSLAAESARTQGGADALAGGAASPGARARGGAHVASAWGAGVVGSAKANPSASSGIDAAPLHARESREALRQELAQRERAADAANALMPQVHAAEEENLAHDAHRAMDAGEKLGKAMGFGEDGQHALGALAVATSIADAMRDQGPPKDPLMAQERLRQAQAAKREWRSQGTQN